MASVAQSIDALQVAALQGSFARLGIYDVDVDDAEAERQVRIARGVEHACVGCGCSESRACDGGCVWATERLCSRCIGGARR